MVNVDTDLCIGCGNCFNYCSAKALSLLDGTADVDLDKCVECGTCIRAKVCTVNALSMPEFDEIREIRHYLSDPTTTKKLTGVPGRGTEESKTNDVTGRIKRGEIGVCIELGRPGVGTSFRDVEKVAMALSKLPVHFEPENPVTALIVDETGRMDEKIIDERVLSGIVEVKIMETDLADVLKALSALEGKLDTVFSLGLITRFDENGELPILETLKSMSLKVRPNAKINVGLGKPLVEV